MFPRNVNELTFKERTCGFLRVGDDEKAAREGGKRMIKFDSGRIPRIQGDEKNEKKHTIMIVDDEVCCLNSLESLLSEGYHIITALDGQEALDCIQKMEHPEKISLIISDQRMPRLTGIQLFEKLKDIIPNTIRIILTGYDKDANSEAAKEAQIFQIISKPFDPDDLKEKIRHVIEEFERREQKSIKGEV
jgi:YesN/AraC family two-component response regulator